MKILETCYLKCWIISALTSIIVVTLYLIGTSTFMADIKNSQESKSAITLNVKSSVAIRSDKELLKSNEIFENLEFDKYENCKLPSNVSDNLKIYLEAEPTNELNPNDDVTSFASIIYKCVNGFRVLGSKNNLCWNGIWIFDHPKCKIFCLPSQISSITTQTTCKLQERYISCEEPIEPSTIATITCAYGYRKSKENVQNVIVCGDDGEWDYMPYLCEQECGTVAPKGTPYIVGGGHASITTVPWHVGIYENISSEKYRQICGGSILNAKVVISAAHCFWNNAQGRFFDPFGFAVGAGKYYRDYYAQESLKYQVLNVKQIHHHRDYKDQDGLLNLDIVLLLLDGHLVFTSNIKPICVEDDLSFTEKVIHPKMFGRVAGWGLESPGGKSSNELKVIDLPTIDNKECYDKLHASYRPFLTGDKFCGGFGTGWNVCQGDSGGGFVVAKQVDESEVFFLKGLVSSGENVNDTCNVFSYTLFTNIQVYIDMISFYNKTTDEDMLATTNKTKYKQIDINPSIETFCKIPDELHDLVDIYVGLNFNQRIDKGISIPSRTAISYVCKMKNTLFSTPKNYCLNGRWVNWHASCDIRCSDWYSWNHEGIETTCELNGKNISCKDPHEPSTSVRLECKDGYRLPKDTLQNVVACQDDGEWNYPIHCEEICGTYDANQAEIIPWNVAIYKDNILVCSGTIINSRVVISAANCFYQQATNTFIDANNFKITVGKYNQQHLNVLEIHHFPEYSGYSEKGQNTLDIAILYLDRHIRFNNDIKPICVDYNETSDVSEYPDIKGQIAGWRNNDNPNDTLYLIVLDVVTVEIDKCVEGESWMYKKFITDDKICVFDVQNMTGYYDHTLSGSGLFSPKQIGNETGYYLKGVMSFPMMRLVTNLQIYMQFISDFEYLGLKPE